jgi:hypothetical protein
MGASEQTITVSGLPNPTSTVTSLPQGSALAMEIVVALLHWDGPFYCSAGELPVWSAYAMPTRAPISRRL